jgi:hypothetical protein
MMRTIRLATAILLAVTAAAATAQTVPPPPPATAPAVAAAPAVAEKTPEELAKIKYQSEIVCHTSIETGSLIAKHKTCLTRKQWAYVNEENQRQARKFVEDNTGKPTSN